MAGRVLADTAAPAARIDWPAALKEAGLAAFVALILFLPLVGIADRSRGRRRARR